MASYYLNEAVCDLPERTFVDKTIHAFEAKLRSGKTLAVFVHRRPIEGEKGLREVVDDNLALNRRRLAKFTVLEHVGGDVGGVPAALVRTQWRQDGATLYQLQAHVVFEGKVMIFAVSGPMEEQSACDETFDRMVASVAWRTR
jgi:hypothetical protein